MNLLPSVIAYLEHLAQPYSIIQIGAFTGNTPNDPIFDILSRNVTQYAHLHAIEPVKEHFLKLQEAYRHAPHVSCHNCAISSHNGTAQITRYPPIPNDENSTWLQQISSLKANRHSTLWNRYENHHPDAQYLSTWVKTHHFAETVTTKTLKTLIDDAKITNIQLITIDAEGSEPDILPQITFPLKFLHYEHALLADNHHAHLSKSGWKVINCDPDTLAYTDRGFDILSGL